jgi:hypothetical protein
MEAAIGISAARWVVSRALGPITSGLLEPWAASSLLGTNIHELKMELLYAQGMLDNARGKDVRSPALAQLLLELRQLAYLADDVLDELEYFRIQDELNGTYETMDAKGLMGLLVHAQHTVKTHARKLKPPSCSWPAACHGDKELEDGKQGCLSGATWRCGRSAQDADGGCMPKVIASSFHAIGKRLPCYSFPSIQDDASDSSNDARGYYTEDSTAMFEPSMQSASILSQEKKHNVQSPTLKFDRVSMSKKMSDIVEQLKPICAKVSTILNLEILGSNRTTAPETPFFRPRTTSDIIQPKMYGRETHINNIIYEITDGKFSTKDLTVLPIFGLGGIGKTTFAQHIYNKVKTLFHVRIWICVSHNFNASKLAQEILKHIPGRSKKEGTAEEIIEKAVQSEKFLFVLDDIWSCPEEEWKKLLSPFMKGGKKGNIVIVTTRFRGVAKAVESRNCSIKLDHLEHRECMALFESCVFGYMQPWKDHYGLRKTGEQIVRMLKGSPLAVKTVGRLLKTELNIDHWKSILDSKEWELQTSNEDIMPALNLSYNYLPFPVQQCFSYCGLFPEDYKFRKDELIHLWIGLGLLCASDQDHRVEYIGKIYLGILVDHGFFEKVEIEKPHDEIWEIEEEHPRYVIHDLLHELAIKVSSYECLSINSSNLRAIKIPPSVRHMSIIVDSTVVSDKTTFINFRSDLATLGETLKAEKLHTLMLFGKYHGNFVNTLCDLFKKAKALRVISLIEASYNLEDLLQNFSNLLHLRYLRFSDVEDSSSTSMPKSISRLYHLMVLDVDTHYSEFSFPRDMSNLVKLRHYIGQGDSFSPHISEVGKLKDLQDLRRFEVRRESNGFELEQLGQLLQLSESLGIYNLEKVQSREEAGEAKLAQKRYLRRLTLAWHTKRCHNGLSQQVVLEILKPSSSIRALCISGNGGDTFPSWLDSDLDLEQLELRDVSWDKLPSIGTSQGFQNLKNLKLVDLPRLKKWCGNGTSHLLANLEKLNVCNCPKLVELPFSRPTCHEHGQAENIAWFPKLRKIDLRACPDLLPLPPIPWTSSLRNVRIERVGSDVEQLSYSCKYGVELKIVGRSTGDSSFWNVLAFDNLAHLQSIIIVNCTPVPWHHLQVLRSLKALHIDRPIFLLPTDRDSSVQYKIPVERLEIRNCSANGKELTQMLSHFPYLSKLDLMWCHGVSGLGVAVEQQPEMATPASTSSIRMDEAKIRPQKPQTEGLLLLPPHIQTLHIYECPQLSHVSTSIGEGTSAGGGLQDLCTLQSIDVASCPRLLSSNFLFPISLQTVSLGVIPASLTLPPLPNLTKLTIRRAPHLRGEDLLPLLSEGKLTDLTTNWVPEFFVGLKAERLRGIRTVRTDCVAGFLVMPICDKLSYSLTSLSLNENSHLERFTKDQEEALQSLALLQVLEICYYVKLQSGPAGLSALPNLKALRFRGCPTLQSLSKDSIPSSLERLFIDRCPQLWSIPKGGLQTNSLRAIHLSEVNEELEKQCQELTIPIFRETVHFQVAQHSFPIS